MTIHYKKRTMHSLAIALGVAVFASSFAMPAMARGGRLLQVTLLCVRSACWVLRRLGWLPDWARWVARFLRLTRLALALALPSAQ